MIEAVVAIVIALTIVLLILLSTYNALMQQRQEVRAAWAQMDETLKQRYDLIPQLVNTVQAVGGETAGKLSAVSTAKNQAAVAFSPDELARAETALSKAIHEVLTSAERDSSLSANPAFGEIQRKILASEKQIEQARKRYNDQVETLNASIHSFPYLLTAKAIGLHLQPGFQA